MLDTSQPRATRRGFRPHRLAAVFSALALAFGITAAFTPSASAAMRGPATPNSCIHTVKQLSDVYDSYGNSQGVLELVSSTCNNGWVAEFLSDDNTWKTVTLYVEYAYQYGFSTPITYGYAAYSDFYSNWFHGTSCYYAEVDLVDNRGNDNWVGTANAGPGC